MTAPIKVDIAALVKTRVEQPGLVAEAAAARRRPTGLTGATGRLLLVAADHSARGALRAGDDPMAIADRSRLLETARCRARAAPGWTACWARPTSWRTCC